MTYKLDVRGPLMSDIQRHVWRQRELSLSPTNRKLIQILIVLWLSLGTLSKDDDDGSENVAKKMNLRSFKHNRVYLDPLNMSNAGDFSWS